MDVVNPSRARFRRVGAAAAVGAALAAQAVLTGAPAAAQGGAWRVLPPPVPNDRRSSLSDADAIGATSAWAAGVVSTSAGDATYPSQPLVLRLNGGRWVSTQVADIDPTGEYVRGVAAAGSGDGWLAGEDSNGIVTRRWNGSSWNRVPFGLRADEDGYLQPGRITAAGGRAWMITTGIFGGYSHGRVAAWTGSAWQWLPDITTTYGDLYDIDAAAANAVWAVGGSFDRGLVYQWNGSRWIDRLPGRADLNLVNVRVVNRNNVWVSGQRRSDDGFDNVLLNWNGSAWSEHVAPETSFGGGLTVTSDGAVWQPARGEYPDRAGYLRYTRSGGFQTVYGPERPDAFGVTVNDLVTVPVQAEPLMVGTVSVLGSPTAATTEARLGSGGAL